MKNLIALLLLPFFLMHGCKKSNSEHFTLLWEFRYTKQADGLSLLNSNPHVLDNGILIAPDTQFSFVNKKMERSFGKRNLMEILTLAQSNF